MKLASIIFFVLALVSSALAGERAALLIGNAAYQKGTSLPALDTPPLDVAAMGQALRAAQFDVTVETDLTTAAMREKVVAFTRAHRDADALLVYVSGHGVQVDGENYLPGVDADLNTSAAMANLARTFPGMSAEERDAKEREVIRFTAGKQMVRLSVVLDALASTAQGEGRVRMIFLDTCRSPFRGAPGKGMLGGKSGGGLAPVSERPGLFIGFAALANQEAQQNEAGHPSLFTEALAAQIRQPGLQLEQVFKRTSRAVTERSRALQAKGVIGEEQTPAAYSVLQEDFVFVPEKVFAKADPMPPRIPALATPPPSSLPSIPRSPSPTPAWSDRSGAPRPPLHVLLITGGCCHDFANQKDILKTGLEERANVVVTQIYSDDKGIAPPLPIYGHTDYANGYDVVIHAECAAGISDPEIIEGVLKPHRNGIPGVNLHCAMHSYRIGNPNDPTTTLGTPHSLWFEYLGLQSSMHGPQEPIAIHYINQDSPITKGLPDWTTGKEELYNNIKIFDTARPVAFGSQTVHMKTRTAHGAETVEDKTNQFVDVWTNIYNGRTRVFSTTIGHNDDTVADARYLDLVTRGVLWACDKLDADGKPKPGYGPRAR